MVLGRELIWYIGMTMRTLAERTRDHQRGDQERVDDGRRDAPIRTQSLIWPSLAPFTSLLRQLQGGQLPWLSLRPRPGLSSHASQDQVSQTRLR